MAHAFDPQGQKEADFVSLRPAKATIVRLCLKKQNKNKKKKSHTCNKPVKN